MKRLVLTALAIVIAWAMVPAAAHAATYTKAVGRNTRESDAKSEHLASIRR
jgi:hypothetical protein